MINFYFAHNLCALKLLNESRIVAFDVVKKQLIGCS
jgi:hypothetical protein